MSFTNANKNALLDFLLSSRKLKNDAALSRLLKVNPATLSKIRHKRIGITAEFILLVHEKLSMPVADIRQIMAQDEARAAEG